MSSSFGSAICVENLGKCFRFYRNRWDRLRGALFHSGNHAQEVWAVRHLDFDLTPGTTLGVIGPNGAGKTTLLQLLSGLLRPTEGSVRVQGNLATLLDLGASFQMDLSGRENIFVHAGLRGFTRKEIERKLEAIISFSELEEFIDHPVRHYSSGMLMRLSFATAINVEPDVFLIDEVFAVGDMAFQHKCTRKFKEMQRMGTTVVLVTHDMTAVKSLCTSAILMEHGRVRLHSNPEVVTNLYLDLVAKQVAARDEQESGTKILVDVSAKDDSIPETAHRHGTGQGRIQRVEVLNLHGQAAESLPFGSRAVFRFHLQYLADVPESGLGFFIRDRYGNDILGINTFEEGQTLGSRKTGDRVIVEFGLPLYLRPGTYSISPGFSYHRSDLRYMDWIDNAALFVMDPPLGGQNIHGLVYVPNEVSVTLVE